MGKNSGKERIMLQGIPQLLCPGQKEPYKIK